MKTKNRFFIHNLTVHRWINVFIITLLSFGALGPTMASRLAAAPVAPNENGVYVENFTTYTNKAYVEDAVWDVWDHDLKLSPNDGMNQSSPDVAMSANHSYFAVWLDGRGGGGYYIQRLDAEGNRLWAEDVRANVTDLGGYNKSAPRIATGPDNNAYIVWADDRSGNWDVYAQRIDTNGNVLWTSDVRANETGAGNQSIPSVTVDASNHAFIVWDDDQAGHNVYTQRISPTGAPQWVADVQVNENPTNQTYSPYTLPAISANTSGVIAVSWLGYAQSGATNMTVYVQRISSSGSRVWINDFEVGSSTPVGIANRQDMDVDLSGNIFVAWTDNDTNLFVHKISSTGNFVWSAAQLIYTGPSQVFSVDVEADNLGGILCTFVKSGIDVYASWLDSSGALLWSSPFKVNYKTYSAYYWQAHAIMDSTNSAIVVWSNDMGYRMYAHDSFAHRLNRNGTREWDRDAVIHSRSGTTVGGYPLVARSGSNFFAAWRDSRNGCGDIYINRFDGTGQRLWQSDVRINPPCQGSTTSDRDFDLATYSDGSAIIVYFQWPAAVVAQAIDIYGNKLWAQPLSIVTDGGSPKVEIDVSDNAIVVWRSGGYSGPGDVLAQKIDRSGQLLWAVPLRVNATANVVGNCGDQTIAIDTDSIGNVFVSWEDLRISPGAYSPSEVYAQKLNTSGIRQWGADVRVQAIPPTNSCPSPALSADETGGAYVSWNAYASNSDHTYAQRLTSAGARAWFDDLEILSWGDQSDIVVANGDAFIIFWRYGYQPLMNRINANGDVVWPGWIYAGSTTGSGKGAAIEAINGHLLVAWGGSANGTTSIYAQLIDPSSDFLWGTDQRIAPGDFYFYPTGSAQSQNINQLAGALNQATLTSDLQSNGGVVQFYLTNDGGADWFPVTPGVTHVFTTTGSDLRWRAELIADPLWPRTPVVNSIRIEYSTQAPYADGYEPDDACSQAKPITVNGAAQAHTFHQYADADWVWFDVISGTTYVLQTANPQLNADTTLELRPSCPQPPLGTDDNVFGRDARIIWRATFTGQVYTKATNHSANIYGPDTGYDLSVRTYSQPPVVVIVGGHDNGYSLQSNIDYLSDLAYRTFLNSGVPKANIRYFSPTSNRDVDGNGLNDDIFATATITNVRDAVQDWSRTRGVSLGVPFYLYLVDHGYYDQFLAAGSTGRVFAEQLNLWLSNLEATSGADNINVILEACKSGSFIDVTALGPSKISGRNRVVIASTSSTLDAYPSMQGAYFSDVFWTAVGQNQDLKTAFETAKQAVQATGLSQQPWLDDNGDAVADAQDGPVASGRGLGLSFGDRAPTIDWVQVGDMTGGAGTVQAQIRDDFGVDKAWLVVYPPGFIAPPPSSDPTTPVLNVPTRTLSLARADLFATSFNGFTQTGHYRLVVYAQDAEQHQAVPFAMQVCVNCSFAYLPLVTK